jgi:photosystem II stability/assembly factor-like uncharacterized protein
MSLQFAVCRLRLAGVVVALLIWAGGVVKAEEVFHGVAVTPDGMNAWVVTIDSTGIYHTGDFGANWQSQTADVYRDYFDVFFLDEQNGWICGRGGVIWNTTSGGDSWTRQNLAGPKFASRIQFTDANHGWVAGGEAIILRTTDGGVYWQMAILRNPPYPADTVDFYGISFVDSMRGWVAAGRYPDGDSFTGGQGYIVRLTVSGDTLAEVLQRRDTIYDFFDVEFVDSLNGWVVGGNDLTMAAAVLHTTDGGGTWVEQSVPGSARLLRAVKFVSPTHGWACGRNGTILRTSDAGANWEQQATGVDTTLFDIDFADSLRGMASGSGATVLSTIDGGNTWERCFSAVAEPSRAGLRARSGLAVLGNPARGEATFAAPGIAGSFGVVVYDAAGCPVRNLRGNGPQLVWDGRNETGQPVQSGLYLARLVSAAASGTARFVLLRQ